MWTVRKQASRKRRYVFRKIARQVRVKFEHVRPQNWGDRHGPQLTNPNNKNLLFNLYVDLVLSWKNAICVPEGIRPSETALARLGSLTRVHTPRNRALVCACMAVCVLHARRDCPSPTLLFFSLPLSPFGFLSRSLSLYLCRTSYLYY